jgi:hypothetical protein
MQDTRNRGRAVKSGVERVRLSGWVECGMRLVVRVRKGGKIGWTCDFRAQVKGDPYTSLPAGYRGGFSRRLASRITTP